MNRKSASLKQAHFLAQFCLLFVLLLSACKGKDGAVGPAGTNGINGTNGTNGKDGNANVISTNTVTVTSASWRGSTGVYGAEISTPGVVSIHRR